MRYNSLGMNRINNRWEVREGTEMMGMKWVARHWIYEEGKQNRRISYNDERGDWEFEDGSRPERVHPGLREIAGHWETTDGTSIDPTLMKHLDFADALHDWAIKVAKFVPLGIEAVKLGLQVPERTFIIRSTVKCLSNRVRC
jgi:hypothetical protein